MSEYLKFKESNCMNCYKCIRHCPVKSIQFFNHQAHIIEDECILCGNCVKSCPQNAKVISSDKQKINQWIQNGDKVYVSVAPSFVAYFENATIESLRSVLRQLGFTDAFETAIGAKIVKEKYDEIVNEESQDIVISTCCPTVNLLVEKYYPDLVKYLAKVLSPMQVHGNLIKQEHQEGKVVFVGPCISKKYEADLPNSCIDAVLTFDELSEWMETKNIELEPKVDQGTEGKTRLFPISGGILASMSCNNPNYEYLVVDGIDRCIEALENMMQGNLHHCFIEMSSCAGSCIQGPGMEKRAHFPITKHLAVRKYSRSNDFIIDKNLVINTEKTFYPNNMKKENPSDAVIDAILQKMGKTGKEHELNCGSCGYDTCREKAKALYYGKADLTMCLPYLKEKAESFTEDIVQNTPNGIIVLNEALEIQLVNKAACEILRIGKSANVINEPVIRILDPLPYLQVVNQKKGISNKRHYLAEYNKYVDEAVIYDSKFKVVMIIMRDVTIEEEAKVKKDNISRQTIEVTDKIIEKQMRAVQEIASLLGESTAETKVALTKLKESLTDE